MNEQHSISTNTSTKYFELTQSQLLIWTGLQLNPESAMYNMAFAFELKGAINEELFKKAFWQLVQECDAMRTVFEVKEGQPLQKIYQDFSYEFEILNFSNKPQKETYLKEWQKKRSQQIFDISKCLFDSVLIKMEQNRYVWFLNQHHLITDGWSKTVQYKRMAEYYQEKEQKAMPQFEDYIRYEKEQRSKSIDETKATYWKDLENLLPSPPALFGKINPQRDSRSLRSGFRLSKEKTEAFRALTNEPELRAWTADLSLFNILSTLLFASIYQLSGQQELAIGIPVPNRPQKSFKDTPGLFTELFPLRTSVAAGDTFATLFEKVRNESFECLKHAGPGSSNANLSKGFNVVLNYMNGNFDDFGAIPVNAEWIFADHADPGHHLRLQVFDFNKEGTIDLQFDFNKSIFNPEEQAIVLQQFSDLLDQFIENRNQVIPNISAAEKTFLQSLNNPEVNFPKDKTVVDLFESQVQKHPDKIALIFEEENITYRQLNERANQLANYLRKKGIKEETLVGICLERSPTLIIAIVAIIKAGGTYVPIDPNYPKDRISYMITDAKLTWVISESKHQALFSEGESSIVFWDSEQEEIAEESMIAPTIALRPEHSIYVIYTSGSTGKPKGVLIEHRNVVRLFFNDQALFDFNEKDVWTLFHSYCFDFSVWEMYGALLFGGSLVIVPQATTKDPEAFTQLLLDQKVTVLNQTPAAFYMLQDFYLPRNEKADIRYVIFGGEALAPARLSNWKKAYPNCQLINMYGITETTVHVTYQEISNKEIESGISNIGLAIPTLECLILDEHRQLVPRGRKGELYVGGAGLARAYLNRPQLSQERFVPHPFSTDSGRRLYKTGDLGMRLSDGTIQYLGRLDNQVKIRGHRIELGEIESILDKHPTVKQSVVIASVNQEGDKRLIAYVTTSDTFDQQEILAYLRQQLPAFMLPAAVMKVEAFPLTVNGKIDKSALPALDFKSLESNRELVEARNEFEEMISEIWSGVLNMERIDIYEDFFRLGGDSLSAIRVMSRINEAFELELPVNLIFENSTIERLATEVEATIRILLTELDNSEST